MRRYEEDKLKGVVNKTRPTASQDRCIPPLKIRFFFTVFVFPARVDDFFHRLHEAFVGDVPAVGRQRLRLGVDDRLLDDGDAVGRHQVLTPLGNRVRLHQETTRVERSVRTELKKNRG